jgi:hypothetical protein
MTAPTAVRTHAGVRRGGSLASPLGVPIAVGLGVPQLCLITAAPEK